MPAGRRRSRRSASSSPSSPSPSDSLPSSADGGDDDDAAAAATADPPTTKTPAPSPYAFPNYDDDDDDDDDDDINLLEIIIETLTGTTFQVRVSPWETGAGLKGLLQRTQGIPASHQHILIGQTELTDEAPLIDQGVQDGSSLKLILAMKGGPMNSRRISTYDDSLWREFSDYMDVNREDLWENEPGRPVTLLVLREGDAVNLYRVLENDDGTFSPLNESWASSNGTGSVKSDSISEKDHLLEETFKHQQKMAELNSRMESLKIKNNERRKKKKEPSKPSSPRVKVPSASRVRKVRNGLSQSQRFKKDPLEASTNAKSRRPKSGVAKVSDRPHRAPSRVSRLPPVQPTTKSNLSRSLSRPTTQETSSNDIKRLSISRGSRILDELPARPQPKHVEFSYHTKLDSIRTQRNRKGSLHTLKEDTNPGNVSDSGTMPETFSKLEESRQRKSIEESREAWSGRDVPFPLYIDPTGGGSRRRANYKTRLNQSYNVGSLHPPRDFDDRPKTSPEIMGRRINSAATSSTMSDRIHLRAPDDKLNELITILNTSRASSRLSDHSSPSRGNPTLPSFHKNSQDQSRTRSHARNLHMSGRTSLSMSLASLKGLTPPSTPSTSSGEIGAIFNSGSREQIDLLKDMVKNQIPSSRRSTPEGSKRVFRRPGSGQFKATVTPRGVPPVTPKRKPKKIRPRCNECKKKIGLVNSYPCRCGHVFCAQHRYAETHTCTFDYKSAGKKLIKIANPLVVPSKLPKI